MSGRGTEKARVPAGTVAGHRTSSGRLSGPPIAVDTMASQAPQCAACWTERPSEATTAATPEACSSRHRSRAVGSAGSVAANSRVLQERVLGRWAYWKPRGGSLVLLAGVRRASPGQGPCARLAVAGSRRAAGRPWSAPGGGSAWRRSSSPDSREALRRTAAMLDQAIAPAMDWRARSR